MRGYFRNVVMIPVLWLVCACALVPATLGLDNGLARTPPMGWLSWLKFQCNTDCDAKPKDCLSEDLIKRTADKMVSDGYRDVGYEYVIIDDCWLEKERDANGRMVPDRKRFKSGIKALADYLHERKIKLGMYQSMGNVTCMDFPGEYEHEDIDIKTFVEWDVDYLKLDGCGYFNASFEKAYTSYGEKLNATGRPIVYSCSWPAVQSGANYTVLKKICNLWRNHYDIEASWSSIEEIMNWYGSNQDDLIPYAGPGHWNDPDMLVTGDKRVSRFHSGVQMAVWAMLSAPLLMSTDLDSIAPEYKQILLDKTMIEINQDPLGKQGRRVFKNHTREIWKKEIKGGLVSLIIDYDNKGSHSEITFEQLNLPKGIYTIQDYNGEKPAVTVKWAPESTFKFEVESKEYIKFHVFTPVTKDLLEENYFEDYETNNI